MGSSVSCDHSSSVSCDHSSFRVGSGSCLCSPDIDKSCVKYEQLACNDMEKNTMHFFLEELESYSVSEEDVNESIVEDVSETMRISDHLEPLTVKNLSLEQETLCNKEAEPISLETDAPEGLDKHASTPCSELSQSYLVDSKAEDVSPSIADNENFHRADNLAFEQPLPENLSNKEAEPISLEMGAPEGLDKHASTPGSELFQLYLVDSEAEDVSPSIADNENFRRAENLAFEQPLPTSPPKLVSALKGSRARQGMMHHLNTKLSVKWSPEVYDPPVTSSSHTVKGHLRQLQQQQHHHHHHHHHSKAKRDHHKQPYIKGKSSSSRGGSVSERKHAHRRSSCNQSDPRILRLERLGCNRPLPNSCGQSKVEPVVDILPVRSNQKIIEFGGSCYMEPLAPVQLPVAEAS